MSALETIDELNARYREQPSHRLARELVTVRNAAFAELPKTPGRPVWPAPFPDPFPGAKELVEASPAELTGDLLGGAITHHGCLRVNGLLDADTAERLRTHIERAFEDRAGHLESGAATADAWYDPYMDGREKAEGFASDRFVRVVDVPDAACDLVEVFAAAGITSAVTEYFGERPAMIANKWVLRRFPNGPSFRDFHQDGAFLGRGIRTVDCWIALSHCGPGTGRPALEVVPIRVDRVFESDSRSIFDWSLAVPLVEEALPEAPVASPVFAPGDALFFDELLLHRTSAGNHPSPRYAIESWFVAPSSYPDKHLPIVL